MSDVYLGLDTATPFLALALWSPQEGLLASSSDEVGRDHARRLVGALDTMMEALEVPRERLRGIGVGTGPGSYTGLRIGMAAAKGLARGLKVPVRGAPTLEAIAANVLQEAQRAVVALDAGRERVYCGIYEKRGGRVHLLGEIARLERQAAEALELPVLEGPPSASHLAEMSFTQREARLEPYYL